MSQPPAYTPTTDFSADESNNSGGRSTVRTANLDAEFANVQTTTDAIRSNLSLLQRDDGKIRDEYVELYNLSPTVRALMQTDANPRGAWVTATAYAVNDLVESGSAVYLCATAHTSGTFATDYAAGKWMIFSISSFTQSGTGAGSRTYQSRERDTVHVTDFYANGTGVGSTAMVDPTGVVDSTLGIQAAIDSLPSRGGTVYFPNGNYKATSTITINKDRVHLVGAGMHATTITFVPTADDICLDVTKGASVIYQGSISNMLFYSPETTFSKTAIRVTDQSGYLVENIAVTGAVTDGSTFFWGGGSDSVGVECKGREFGLYRNLYLNADKPLRIADNPNHTLDCDHYHFMDLYLTANAQPCVTVTDGTNLSNVTFDGAQPWVKGTYGLRWVNTTSPVASYCVTFKNVRTEQGTSGTAYMFHIESTSGSIQDVSFDDCYGDLVRNGWYLRGVTNANIKNSHYIGVAGKTVIDATCPTGGWLSWDNFKTEPGSTLTLSGYREQASMPKFTSACPIPPTAHYAYQAGTIRDFNIVNGVKTMKFTGSVANGATVNLLCGANQGVTVADISVSAVGATKVVGGQVTVGTQAGSGVAALKGGTANFNVGNVAGSLTIFATASTVLFNQTGETLTYVVDVGCV